MGSFGLAGEALNAVYGDCENSQGNSQRLHNRGPSKSTRSLGVILSELGSHQKDA